MAHKQQVGLLFLVLWCWGNMFGKTLDFEHLTIGDGLSHNTVYAMLQDQSGMFWIGTRYGLNLYDGYGFKSFTTKDELNPINGPSVLSLMEDRRGQIWVGHQDAGISVYNKATGKFTAFTLSEGGDNPVNWSTITVRSLFQDSRGYIWIGTFGGGVIVLNEQQELLYHLSTYTDSGLAGNISSDFVFDFSEDDQCNVYVATAGKGINLVDFQKERLIVLHASDEADLVSYEKALCVAANGDVWIGTSGSGLYRYRPVTKEWKNYSSPSGISHQIVTDVTEDKDGNIWLTTDGGGLNLLHLTDDSYEVFMYSASRKTSLNSNALYCLFFDQTDNLWVGSFNGGVNLNRSLKPPFLTERRYDLERQYGLRSVLSIAKDATKKTWLGTDGGGLFYFQNCWADVRRYTKTTDVHVNRKIDKVITALATTAENNLWFGSYAGGLGFLNVGTGEVIKYRNREQDPKSLAHDNVWDLAIDSSGGVWIGLLGGGLDYLAPGTSTFLHFPYNGNDPESISGLQVVDILLDQNDRYLWVATENAGLNRLDITTGKFLRFRHDPADSTSISSDRISNLFQDTTGNLWIGTEYDGLSFLAKGTNYFKRYNKQNGYPFEMVRGIEIDQDGYMWVSELSKILRWNRDDDSFLELPAEKELDYNLYNSGAILKLADGSIVFGGVNGFSVVEPNHVFPTVAPPNALISEFRLANQPVTPGEQDGRIILTGDINADQTIVYLTYQDRGIAFYFASPAYPIPDEVRYSFQLEGFDNGWNENDPGERSAYYSSLKGGKYRLRVRAAGNDGQWGPEIAPLVIIVKPPFWRTRWFVFSIICLVIGFIYALNRFLLNRQRERYQQQALVREQEILRLKNKNLKEEVLNKQSELGASLLQMAHKNEFLNDLKNKIQQLNDSKEAADPSKSLRSVIRVINHELKQEDYWEQFQLIFDQSYRDFVDRLRQHHPDLSINDSRLSCFIRMQLNNREIASVLNITLNGVEQAKYRLKKKMALPPTQNLNQYIESFG